MCVIEVMCEVGCGVFVVFGGDGMSWIVSKVWENVFLFFFLIGMNNVFFLFVEVIVVGVVVGVVVSGVVFFSDCSCCVKVVCVECDGDCELVLIDVGLIVDDYFGNVMLFDGDKICWFVLMWVEVDSVGMLLIGGLFEVCGVSDDVGVVVDFDFEVDVDLFFVLLLLGFYC